MAYRRTFARRHRRRTAGWHPRNRPRVAVSGAVSQWSRSRLRSHVFPIMPSWFPPGTAPVDYQPISARSHDREADVTLLPGNSQLGGIVIDERRGSQPVIAGHPPQAVRVGGLALRRRIGTHPPVGVTSRWRGFAVTASVSSSTALMSP
jgi:hypothetical protein